MTSGEAARSSARWHRAHSTASCPTHGNPPGGNPGCAADLYFDIDTGAFDLTVESSGAVTVLNDHHKRRGTAPFWRWVIDLSAVALIVISPTGLVMQFFLRKGRRSASSLATSGEVLMWLMVN